MANGSANFNSEKSINQMIRLSVIIPMWNAERYIERCVSSCYRQGLEEEEFEILIANDGSTDGSVDIVKRLQNEHSNILLFSQENAGAGMARNLGLNHATGRYVMFVDSDDYLNPDTLKPILELAEEKDLDVCRYDMECITLDTGAYTQAMSCWATQRFRSDRLVRRFTRERFWKIMDCASRGRPVVRT